MGEDGQGSVGEADGMPSEAKSGADLRVPAPGQAKKVAMLGSLNYVTHELIVHTSPTKLSRAALAARAHWLTVEWLPKYTPELNDIEVVWHDLKAYNLAHQTFTGVAELDAAIHMAVEDLNCERAVVPLAKPRISA
jgi:DDE superfamily endonuclease